MALLAQLTQGKQKEMPQMPQMQYANRFKNKVKFRIYV
jgi:hypothetical protein